MVVSNGDTERPDDSDDSDDVVDVDADETEDSMAVGCAQVANMCWQTRGSPICSGTK